jgi:hypothetical protein
MGILNKTLLLHCNHVGKGGGGRVDKLEGGESIYPELPAAVRIYRGTSFGPNLHPRINSLASKSRC